MERKERQRAELRETILAAARRIFLQDGFEGLTMRKIAEAIEYSPGTLYLYFESREQIAMQLVREGFEALGAALRPTVAIADSIERLHALAIAFIDYALNNTETYKLMLMEDAKYVYAAFVPTGDETEIEAGEQAFAILRDAVTAALADGTLRPIDPTFAAQAFWAGMHGAIALHVTCTDTIEDPRAVALLVADSMVAGLRA